MPDNRKNDDIEELSLDGEVELKINDIKIEPSDINVENLDFDTSDGQVSESSNDSASSDNSTDANNMDGNTSNSNVSGDSSSTEKNDDTASEELSADSGNDTSGVSDGSSESGADDVNNGENASGETGALADNNGSEKKDEKNGQENPDDKPDGEDKDKKDSKPEDDKKGDESQNQDDKNKDNQGKDKNSEDKNKDDQNGNKNPDDKNKDDQDGNKNKDDKKEDGAKTPKDNKPNDTPDTNKPQQNKPGQRKNSLKDKWDNRPKTPKDFANRAKNHAKNAARNKARDAMDNSSIGRGINNVKDGIDKGKKAVNDIKKTAKIVKVLLTSKVFLIVLACILVVVIISVLPSMLASGSPGVGGEVEEEENYSKYSEEDQKTIDNLKEKTKKHPTGDPTYAMAATLYPYIEEMQNGNVGSLRGKTNVEQEDDPDLYEDNSQAENNDQTEDNADENTENGSESSDDSSGENGSGTTANDPYLELFREKNILGQEIYLKKFETLLTESEAGEEALTEFLKNEWFKKDKGYKELFDGVDNSKELTDAIIDDLLNQKSDFEGYFFENEICSVNLESIGTIEIDDMLKGNILVDVKVSSCTTGKDVWGCESMYDAPITMEKYVKGVTYEEIGASGSSDVEKIKAQLVAAKSYVIGRSKSMGWGAKQDSLGNYVITVRANTNDQDYCDIDLGCSSGKTVVREGSRKRDPVDSATRAKLDEAWQATKDVYIYSDKTKTTAGEFCNNRSGVCDFCSKGTCLAHQELNDYRNVSYDKILGDQYSSYALMTIQGDYADAKVSTGETCSVSGLGIPDDQFQFYYQTDYHNVAFCGATNHKDSCDPKSNSICSSGCGVTSLAMLVANLSDDVSFDPVAANEEGKNNGGCAVGKGSNDNLFIKIATNHEGFSYEQLANTKEGANNAVAAIRDGALVVANVQSNSPFTTGGHWIVLRGITEDGMVKVADPNSETRSTSGSYNIEDFIDKNWLEDHHWFAIYGPKSAEIKAMNDAASEQGAAGEVIDTTNGIKGQFFAPIQNDTLKMYGKNSTNGGKYHDLGASCGTPVYSPADGTVTFKTITKGGNVASYGNVVEINTVDGYRIVLAHLKSFVGYNVKYGTGSNYPSSCSSGSCNTYTYGTRPVKKGEKLGLSGTSGNSTGCHLHVEIWNGDTRLEPSGLLGYGVR